MIIIKRNFRVNVPVEKAYYVWDNFEKFQKDLNYPYSIKNVGDKQNWTIRGPFNEEIEFHVDIIEKQPNEQVKWTTTHEVTVSLKATIHGKGEMHFKRADDGKATEVDVEVIYDLPEKAKQQILDAIVSLSYSEKQFDEEMEATKDAVEKGLV